MKKLSVAILLFLIMPYIARAADGTTAGELIIDPPSAAPPKTLADVLIKSLLLQFDMALPLLAPICSLKMRAPTKFKYMHFLLPSPMTFCRLYCKIQILEIVVLAEPTLL